MMNWCTGVKQDLGMIENIYEDGHLGVYQCTHLLLQHHHYLLPPSQNISKENTVQYSTCNSYVHNCCSHKYELIYHTMLYT